MPDLVNKVLFKIPPTLRGLQGLPLKDKLKELFSPFTGSGAPGPRLGATFARGTVAGGNAQ